MSLRRLFFLLLAMCFAVFGTVGALKIPIKEYDVPTPHARPHDPAVAPDGALWVTEQMANKLGRLDPNTGKFREYPLKTPDSGPHGLVADPQGNIWFAAIFAGYVGKLSPNTGVRLGNIGHPVAPRSTPTRPYSTTKAFLVSQRGNELHRAAESYNGQNGIEASTDPARHSIRHSRDSERGAVLLRVRHEQAGEYRPEHDDHSRVLAAISRCPTSAACART